MHMLTGRFRIHRLLPLLGVPVLFALACTELRAATIFVTSATDSFSTADGCSIREALINANTDSKSGSVECARGSGADLIVLPPQTINMQGSAAEEDDPRVGDLDVTSDITFIGGGAQFSLLEADYGGRIFDVQAGGTLTVRGLTLQRGMAAQEGGAIRANLGSTLNINDVVIGSAIVSASAVGGRGGAIYIGPGVAANLSRMQIAYNTALGLNGEGGGIYCDGCQLAVTATTFNDNEASASGGALYAAPGSSVALSFVTFGYNGAAVGAGMHLLGDATLRGVLAADNGSGLSGDDLLCTEGTFSATYSFVEFPGADCVLGTSNKTRSDVAPAVEPALLQEALLQRFDGQPSGVLQWRYGGFFAVPAAQCAGYSDQHGRRGADIDDCDIGAFSRPVLGVNPMVSQSSTNGDPSLFGFGLFRVPTVDTLVHLNPIGGIAEPCNVSVPDISIPANSVSAQLLIDPDTLFSAPAIGRPFRVCEFELVVTSGPSTLVGARSGVLRIKLNDTSLAAAAGVSSPPPGTYLEFGSVPVGSGGTANLVFLPAVAGWDITGISFGGADPSRFSSPAAGFPIPVRTRDEGGTSLPFQCAGGVLGAYDALIQVNTNNPTFPVLVYAVRCRVVHLLSLIASGNLVSEAGGGGSVEFTVALDSASVLPGPLSVDLAEVAGSATSLSGDYSAFGQTITFNPGEQQHSVSVSIFDDTLIEDTETFGARLVLAPQDDVQLVGASEATVVIANDDYPVQAMTLALDGIPERTAAGVRIAATAVVTNTGTDPLHDLGVTITVDAPVRIVSFAIASAACGLSGNQRSAQCTLDGDVPSGESRTFAGTIEMAEMKDAPMLDLDGVVAVSATATAATIPLAVTDEASYTIIGQGINLGSVTSFSLLPLLLLGLRGIGRSAGRMTRRIGC
ncbi:MAG: Calx-beta domain-containing protein [Pseudomonadota bacterium]